MKKYLLIGVLAIAGMAFANPTKLDPSQIKKESLKAQKIEAEAGPFVWKDLGTILDEHRIQRAKAADSYADVDWYTAPGTFHGGIYDGGSFYSIGMILVPAVDSIVYSNWCATNWYEDGELAVENSKTYSRHYNLFTGGYDSHGIFAEGYLDDVPVTGDHELVYGSNTYLIKGTSYGIGSSWQHVVPAWPAHTEWWDGENFHMTLCAMRADTLLEGQDIFMVGGRQTADPYQDGCGIHLDSANRVLTADTLGVLVDNIALMKIERIILPVYYKDDVDTFTTYIPDGAEIKLELFPLTDTGIDFANPIAETVVTNKDFTPGSTQDMGTLAATFKDVDVFGEITEVPVYVNGSFFLQITNYNESGCDFGFLEDFYCDETATTIYKYNGSWSYRYSRGRGGKYGQNLAISFDAYFPAIFNDTTANELIAPIEGGFAHYGEDVENNLIWTWTNVDPDNWDIEFDTEEAEEWLEVTTDNEDFADYVIGYAQIEAQALPEGVAYREATVTINADGATLEFVVKQGTNPEEAIDNVNFKNDGKSYNVLGIEVNDDYKGVIIRNGEKFIR